MPRMKTARSLATLLLALFLTSFLAAQAAPAADPAELVKQGRKLLNDGDPDQALAHFQKALAASPDLYDAHLSTGIALDLKGQYAEARKHLARALEVAPADQKPRALRTLAVSYAFEGNAAEAARYEQQVFDARLAGNDFAGAAEIANELARIYLESGDLAPAEKWYRTGYDTALRTQELASATRALWDFRWEHAQARIAARRGQKEQAQKHVAAAKAAFDQAVLDKENAGQARFFPYLTGYVAFYGGDYRQAIAELAQADQRDPFILALLAQAHEKSGDAAGAQALYRKVLESTNHGPTNAFARPLAQRKLAAK